MADDLVQRLHVASTKMAALFGHMLDILGRDGVREIGLDPDSDGDVFKEAADALARKDAEIAELRKEVNDLWIPFRLYAERKEMLVALRQRAERAEARVREAPVCRVVQAACTDENREPVHQIIMYLKPVALVLLDTDD